MQTLRKILVLSVITLVIQGVIGTDYCKKKCRNGKPHIGCSDGKPAKGCVNFKPYYLPTAATNLILNLHNTKRNRVALGEESRGLDEPLEPATNMNELTWSYEFANLSMFNVLQCKLAHDNCRGTDEFPHAGQNLGYYTTNDVNAQKNIPNIIIRLINNWYDEVRNVPTSLLKSYKVINDGIARGHFTQMMWADATKIGCAVGTYGQLGTDFTVLLCCDYSIGNMLGKPTYDVGTPRSKCRLGYSRKYPGLCGTKGITKPAKSHPVPPPKIKTDDYLDDDKNKVLDRSKDLDVINEYDESKFNEYDEEIKKDLQSLQESAIRKDDQKTKIIVPGNGATFLNNGIVNIICCVILQIFVRR